MPKEFIPAVKKGVDEALQEGVLAGYPVVDVKVTLHRRLVPRGRLERERVQDGGDLRLQGRHARRPAPTLLEPIMAVEVETPEDKMGDVIGDLSRAAA